MASDAHWLVPSSFDAGAGNASAAKIVGKRSMTATGWEIATYLGFAALLGLVLFGLWRASPMARTPFLLAQVFVGIVGYTVFSGDGVAVKVVGAAVLALALVGLWVAFSPGLVDELQRPSGRE